MADTNLNEVMTRAERRYASDGIVEIVMGGLYVTWGAILFSPPWLKFAGAAALVFSAILARWLMKRLKARWTTLRTGYIEPRHPTIGRRALSLICGFAAAVFIPLLLSRGSLDAKTLLAPAVGLLLAILFAIGRAREFTPSGWLYAAVCAGTSASLVALRTDTGWGLGVLFTALGASSIVAGSWRFMRYVRTHPEEQHV
jgi:hypothetical protein